jgi:FMN phosphatase YigB (HAD superfamily)
MLRTGSQAADVARRPDSLLPRDKAREGGTTLLEAVLFDLDGTLLPMDTDTFIAAYVQDVAAFVAATTEPTAFVEHLLAGTAAMLQPRTERMTNETAFMETFFADGRFDKDVMLPLFERYYEERFPALVKLTAPDPAARLAVEAAVAAGHRIAVATNPLFPAVAIEERLRWAGVADLPWDLVTTYEHMHSCKPHLSYYEEILERLGVRPERAMMVGNDVGEDLIAAELGMRTFLVEDQVINRDNRPIQCDFRGPLAAVAPFFEEDPLCQKI